MRHQTLQFEAIGTHWTVETQLRPSEDWQALTAKIMKRIAEFDAAYSRFRSDSLVSQLAQDGGPVILPDDATKLILFYEQLYEATDGAVTPLIGQVMADAGYDANYSLREKQLKKPPRWEDVISYRGHTMTLRQPALLDFGAAGKGYLVDIIGALLKTAGVDEFYINAGGDILHVTDTAAKLQIGLENPNDTSEVVGVAAIHNQSLCASAGNRRKWGQYTHIIDPHVLRSPQDILATWVVANDTMTADGLATALFFTAGKRLQAKFQFSYAVLRSDMSLERSTDFPAKLFELVA